MLLLKSVVSVTPTQDLGHVAGMSTDSLSVSEELQRSGVWGVWGVWGEQLSLLKDTDLDFQKKGTRSILQNDRF